MLKSDLNQMLSDALCLAAREIHDCAVEKGWWEKEPPVSEKICLMHSELSEALEEYRQHGLAAAGFIYYAPDEKFDPKPEGIAVELADCVIRGHIDRRRKNFGGIMQSCAQWQIAR